MCLSYAFSIGLSPSDLFKYRFRFQFCYGFGFRPGSSSVSISFPLIMLCSEGDVLGCETSSFIFLLGFYLTRKPPRKIYLVGGLRVIYERV